MRSCVSLLCLVLMGCSTAGSLGSGAPVDASVADGAGADTAADTATSTDSVTADAAADAIVPPDAAADAAALTCEPKVVKCTDSQILDLSLMKKASKRIISNELDADGFFSQIDAGGGGMPPTESFVYARFTDTGLERVDIGDEAAFDKASWDIAFRRYFIRLDSGVSGPSCVLGAVLPAGTDFDELTAAPAKLALTSESYYDSKCKLVKDGSGLDGPDTVMSGFWEYANCVQMTGKVYIIQIADGRKLKLTVTAYYAPAAQAKCDSTGAVPQGTPGGQIRLRWAFLQP